MYESAIGCDIEKQLWLAVTYKMLLQKMPTVAVAKEMLDEEVECGGLMDTRLFVAETYIRDTFHCNKRERNGC